MARSVKKRSAKPRPASAAPIFANAFAVGAVLMGFEMLGSRYLFPYFGGGIGSWAGLISTVLCALTIGYFAGGAVVDRHPSPRVIAVSICVGRFLSGAGAGNRRSGDGVDPGACRRRARRRPDRGVGALILVPLSLLGTFSPVAVRLLAAFDRPDRPRRRRWSMASPPSATSSACCSRPSGSSPPSARAPSPMSSRWCCSPAPRPCSPCRENKPR